MSAQFKKQENTDAGDKNESKNESTMAIFIPIPDSDLDDVISDSSRVISDSSRVSSSKQMPKDSPYNTLCYCGDHKICEYNRGKSVFSWPLDIKIGVLGVAAILIFLLIVMLL